MEPFKKKFPERFFNLGLTEQSITSMAAGLAIEGFRPIVYSITPFVLENNRIIYINRGWVPKKYVDKSKRVFSLLEGNIKIVGLVRHPQKKGYFVPENEPENGFWFTIIPEEINNYLNIFAENEFYIDELNIDECYLAGWSMGSAVSLTISKKYLRK